MERSRLLGMRVEKLVALAARDSLYLHLHACQESKSSQTCYIPFSIEAALMDAGRRVP